MQQNIEDRQVHDMQEGSQTGPFAELSGQLQHEGYEYQYHRDAPYFECGIAEYKHPNGKTATLKRIRKGDPEKWTNAIGGLVYLGAKADTWQLIKSL